VQTIPTTHDEARAIIREAMDDLQERQQRTRAASVEARPVDTRRRASIVGLAVGVPILIAVLAVNVGGLSIKSLFAPRPAAPVARQEARELLAALVGEIEGFREDYDALPRTLAEVGIPPRGSWTYEITANGRYRVQGTLYGQRVGFEAPR
jgi:hypothetical protein